MSHIIKLIVRILNNKVHSRIKPERGKEQCCFLQDTGTRKLIFMIRMHSVSNTNTERLIPMFHMTITKTYTTDTKSIAIPKIYMPDARHAKMTHMKSYATDVKILMTTKM